MDAGVETGVGSLNYEDEKTVGKDSDENPQNDLLPKDLDVDNEGDTFVWEVKQEKQPSYHRILTLLTDILKVFL